MGEGIITENRNLFLKKYSIMAHAFKMKSGRFFSKLHLSCAGEHTSRITVGHRPH